jgi:chemotaxis methyl-accepting protein methylase
MHKEISNEPIDIADEDIALKMTDIFKDNFSIHLNDIHSFLLRRRLALAFKAQNICMEECIDNNSLLSYEIADQMLCEFFPDHSELFRDSETWLILRDKILNSLSGKNLIHVFFPYVITGEEIYSFLILINEYFPKLQFKIKVKSFSGFALNRISNGYLVKPKSRSSITNFKLVCEKSEISDYLEKINNTFFFKKDFLNKIVFAKYDETIIENEKYDLIFCRNKTQSFNYEKATGILKSTMSIVKENGVIIFGINENIPKNVMNSFQVISWSEKIFQKIRCEE